MLKLPVAVVQVGCVTVPAVGAVGVAFTVTVIVALVPSQPFIV